MAETKRKTFTSTEVKARYNKKTYKSYNVSLRLVDDADLIELIEKEKSAGASTTEAFRKLLRKK
jgi:hypothetical protein